MNRRLKELAADAGYPDYMTYGQDKVLERFSELIVLECASQVRFTDLLLCNDDSDGEILLQASVQLKQHFGVE